MKIRFLAAAALITCCAGSALADEETAALRAQIKALEARLDALERKEAQQQAQISAQQKLLAQQPDATPASPMEQRVSTLEQQQKAASEWQKKEATVSYDYGKGLTIASPDGKMRLRMSGYFQADDRTFISDSPVNNNGQFYIRSARPILDAKYDQFSARMMMDFGNNQSQLLDAYGDYNASDAFSIRIGKFKDPIGIERWQAEQNVLFIERGMTTNLVPFRDNGIELYGNLLSGAAEYQLAFTNGAPDLANGTGALDNDHSVFARLFTHPFHHSGGMLEGIGVGLAGSYGEHDGSAASPGLTGGYVTPTQSRFFTYAHASFASGDQWRINPQATYYHGPLSLIGEYVLEEQGISNGATSSMLQNDAWFITATYVLTGEDARFDGVVPRNNFDPAHGHWGAFELVARTSRLAVDENTFPTFANPNTAARAAHESTMGGTWYMNPNVKLNLNFTFTQFDGGAPAGGDRSDEEAVLTRAQVKF